MMLADIAVGHHAAADVCFLIAVILAGLAALVAAIPRRRYGPADATGERAVRAVDYYVWAPVLGWAAVALLALAWLLL